MRNDLPTISSIFRPAMRLAIIAILLGLSAVEAGAIVPPWLRPRRLPAMGVDAHRPIIGAASAAADSVVEGRWDDRFGPPGTDGEVYAVAVIGTDLYVGGNFSRIGNIEARNIARWDGARWHSLGTDVENGTTGIVTALLADGDSLFVGGQFDAIGSLPVNNLGVWRPASGTWGKIGSGASGDFTSVVTSMVKNGPDLYVGGRFGAVGTTIANNVARWNGTRWSRLKAGVFGVVTALAISGNNLYAGGIFTTAGTATVRNLAVYDMTVEDWAPVGGGVDSLVSAIAVRGNNVYVAGHFRDAGGKAVKNLAVWNEASRQWSAFPLPISFPPLGDGGFDPAFVYDLAIDGSVLYIGGEFRMGQEGTYSFVDSVRGIIGWDLDQSRLEKPGAGICSWNNQIASFVNDMVVANGTLYVGGSFPIAGGYEAQNIAGYRPGEKRWISFGTSVNGGSGKFVTGPTPARRGPYGLRAVAVSGNDVYLGGYFSSAGSTVTRNVVRWKDGTWSALGAGVGGDILNPSQFRTPEHVNAIVARGSEVFVGGRFSTAGGAPARGIARWDGSAWSAVGPTTGLVLDEAMAMVVVGSDVYIGGSAAGGGRLFRWNGTTLDTIIGTFGGPVLALAAVGNDLYVGGQFSTVGEASTPGIIRYNIVNRTWTTLGGGVDRPVRAIAWNAGTLYVGGGLTPLVGTREPFIATWDGSSWATIGNGLGNNGEVKTLAFLDGKLYAGGTFNESSGAPANHLAMWTGGSWIQVDGGTSDSVHALVPMDDHLVVAGDFTFAGTTPAHYLTNWFPTRPAGVIAVAGERTSGRSSIAAVVPNPAGSDVSFRLELARRAAIDLAVYDRLGRRIATVIRGDVEAGSRTIGWNASELPAGTYFCRLTSADGASSMRFDVIR